MARGNFGDRLKRERELREVSIEELTKATRISARFVEALENEDWGRLPGGVFGHGFVRTIARYLGLNEEAFLGEYDLAPRGSFGGSSPQTRGNAFRRRRSGFPFWPFPSCLFWSSDFSIPPATAGIATLPIAPPKNPPLLPCPCNLSLNSVPLRRDQRNNPPPRPFSTSPSPLPPPRGVRILADNKLLLDAELPAGETRHFSASRQFEVTAGDSSAVLLELNGKAMPPLGAPGSSGTMVLTQKDLRP